MEILFLLRRLRAQSQDMGDDDVCSLRSTLGIEYHNDLVDREGKRLAGREDRRESCEQRRHLDHDQNIQRALKRPEQHKLR